MFKVVEKQLVNTIKRLLLTQDEVDALAGQRGSNDDASSRRLLTELLLQMAMAMEQDGLYIFACTNRIQVQFDRWPKSSEAAKQAIKLLAHSL